jgi:hypothetical protein
MNGELEKEDGEEQRRHLEKANTGLLSFLVLYLADFRLRTYESWFCVVRLLKKYTMVEGQRQPLSKLLTDEVRAHKATAQGARLSFIPTSTHANHLIFMNTPTYHHVKSTRPRNCRIAEK